MEEEEWDAAALADDATQEEIELAQQKAVQDAKDIVARRRFKVGVVKLKGGKTMFSVLPPNFKFCSMNLQS